MLCKNVLVCRNGLLLKSFLKLLTISITYIYRGCETIKLHNLLCMLGRVGHVCAWFKLLGRPLGQGKNGGHHQLAVNGLR